VDDAITEAPFSAGEILDLFPEIGWSFDDGLDAVVPLDRLMPRQPAPRSTDAELLRASDAWHASRGLG